MTRLVYHHVLRLEVTINDVMLVEMLDRTDDLCNVKVHIVLHSQLIGTYTAEKVTTF